MREYELDAILNGVPQALAVAVGLRDEVARTCKKVPQKIGEDVDNGLVRRQRREILAGDRAAI